MDKQDYELCLYKGRKLTELTREELYEALVTVSKLYQAALQRPLTNLDANLNELFARKRAGHHA